VRDDFNEKSDIDIIVDFTRPIGIAFIDLADLLEAALKRPVDLVSKKGVKDKYFKVISVFAGSPEREPAPLARYARDHTPLLYHCKPSQGPL